MLDVHMKPIYSLLVYPSIHAEAFVHCQPELMDL